MVSCFQHSASTTHLHYMLSSLILRDRAFSREFVSTTINISSQPLRISFRLHGHCSVSIQYNWCAQKNFQANFTHKRSNNNYEEYKIQPVIHIWQTATNTIPTYLQGQTWTRQFPTIPVAMSYQKSSPEQPTENSRMRLVLKQVPEYMPIRIKCQ